MRNLAKADALRKHAADEGVEVDLEALDAAQALMDTNFCRPVPERLDVAHPS